MYKSYDQLVEPEQPENRDLNSVLEIANLQHRNKIIQSNRIVCIDIYADWCGPCKQTAPNYAMVASKFSKEGFCAVVKYNLEKMSPKEKENIHGIPVFEFFVDGNKVDQIIGADIQKVEETLTQLTQKSQQNIYEINRGPLYNKSSIRTNKQYEQNYDSKYY